jgi:hypothetical protein
MDKAEEWVLLYWHLVQRGIPHGAPRLPVADVPNAIMDFIVADPASLSISSKLPLENQPEPSIFQSPLFVQVTNSAPPHSRPEAPHFLELRRGAMLEIDWFLAKSHGTILEAR